MNYSKNHVTKWTCDQVTVWPSDRVIEGLSDRVTKWQEALQTINRMVYFSLKSHLIIDANQEQNIPERQKLAWKVYSKVQ